MEKLKSCPFCGGEVYIYYSSRDNSFYAVHKQMKPNCILLTPMIISRSQFELGVEKLDCLADAERLWNRRVESDV